VQIGDAEVAGGLTGTNTTLGCYAVSNKTAVTVLCYNFIPYPMPIDTVATEVPPPSLSLSLLVLTAHAQVRVCGLTAAPAAASVRFIDDKHGSARPVWEAMGSPTYPTAAQQQELMAASAVPAAPQSYAMVGGCAVFDLTLTAYGSAAVTLEL
jgi:hypothetical protein